MPIPSWRTRSTGKFTHGFSDTWKDFVTYPFDNRAVTTARERLAVRQSDPRLPGYKPDPLSDPPWRWRVTQDFFTSFSPGKGDGNDFQGMFFDETGGVVIWTRKFTWGIFAECANPMEKLAALPRAVEPAFGTDTTEAPYETEWRDVALFDELGVHLTYRERVESLPPLDAAKTNAFSGNLRITLGGIRRDADDSLVAQQISQYGGVLIWTQHVLACIRSAGNGERIVKLPRYPMTDIRGCYNRFPADTECLPSV